MNKFSKIIVCWLISVTLSQLTFSQTVIDYTSWSTSQCNAFYPSVVIDGLTHTTTCGTVVYNGVNHDIALSNKASNNLYYGTEYKLSFNFKQNFSYTIKINAWCSPSPLSNIRVDFASASNGGGFLCNGVESFNTTSSLNNDNHQQLNSGAFFDYTFSFPSLVLAQNFLYIGSFLSSMTGTATAWIEIKKITITETAPPPTFTLSPASIPKVSGA